MKIAAFDIGGTALKMGVMTREGELLDKGKQTLIDSDGDQILQAMLAWIAAHPECKGVAISAPGYVNPHTGFIEMGGAIRKFDNFAIKAWLEQQVRLPVAIENDANCVLLAERWRGKAADMSNFLVLTIGTGIGGAIFCNNQLVHGARFRAGEFGYMQTARPGTRDVRRYSMNENCTLRVLRHRCAIATLSISAKRWMTSPAKRFLTATMRATRPVDGWSLNSLTAWVPGFTTLLTYSIRKRF